IHPGGFPPWCSDSPSPMRLPIPPLQRQFAYSNAPRSVEQGCSFSALPLKVGWAALESGCLAARSPDILRWGPRAAAVVPLHSLAGLALAVRLAPSPLTVALSLDERFGLKERVTTSLLLAPEQAASPAGQALLADANARVAALRVGDRFPVRLPWKPAALVPL